MLTRRSSLLLPLLFAGCGSTPRRDFPPLRYDYLTPLQLNVAAVQIEQRYMPSGAAPDVSASDPVPPLRALRAMAEDRLQALGSSGQAVFIIQNAALTRRRDTITGSFMVQLDILTAPNARAGYAQAGVSASFSGDLDDLPGRLYDITKDMMDRMNVEFEYQVRRSLGAWLVAPGAAQVPVQQQPLTRP
ncbi:MAG: hypothetical protein WDN25_22225 [Acetobacteraceae bacterium]